MFCISNCNQGFRNLLRLVRSLIRHVLGFGQRVYRTVTNLTKIRSLNYINLFSSKGYESKTLRQINPSQGGFSLVEMALVLAIMGIVAGVSVPVLNRLHAVSKNKVTRMRQEEALRALASYVLQEGHLPCPVPLGAVKSKGFGIAPRTCAGQKAMGMLPFKTLGLPEVNAYDGHKRALIYAVNEDVASGTYHKPFEKNPAHDQKSAFETYCALRPRHSLKILNHRHEEVCDAQKDPAVLILGTQDLRPLGSDGLTFQIPRKIKGQTPAIRWATHRQLTALHAAFPCRPAMKTRDKTAAQDRLPSSVDSNGASSPVIHGLND